MKNQTRTALISVSDKRGLLELASAVYRPEALSIVGIGADEEMFAAAVPEAGLTALA